MKKIVLILLFVPCFILISTQRTKASHAVGMDITYAYAGPNQYTVTVKFYRDCKGIDAPLTMDVDYNSVSCGLNGRVTLNQVPGTGNEIPTGQYDPCYVTSCNGGTGYGVQEYIYTGIVTLPTPCSDWVLSAEVNARNAGITTITAAGTMYVEATLDNVAAPMDTSAVFSTYPVSRFCINKTFHYNQGAVDPQGDSLVFSLVNALQGAGLTVPYASPYTGANPISSNPPATIDPNTGVITFSPNMIQIGIFAVLVQHYHNGVLIGTIRRDMQVNIEATCNEPPLLHTGTINGSATAGDTIVANCGDSIIYVTLENAIFCSSVAPDGSDFRMLSPSGLPIPIVRAIPINCVNGKTDSIEVHLYSLSSRLTENGRYYLWSKQGNDGNTLLNDCLQSLREYDTTSFVFTSCYNGKVDLTNVSVDNGNTDMEVYWTPPSNLPSSQFQSYDVYRSRTANGSNYTKIDVVNSIGTHFYLDTTVTVASGPYDYAIAIHLNTGFVCPASDSIQSIFLTGFKWSDSLNVELNWTPYWGWSNPLYQVMQSADMGVTFDAVASASTNNNGIVFLLPNKTGTYFYRIHTVNGILLSRSNWIQIDVTKPEIVPPNVFTPDGDGVNDKFEFIGLEYYPNSKIRVFDRWGTLVFENANYQNNWDGGDQKDGVYYYTLKLADFKATEMNGTVNIFRGK